MKCNSILDAVGKSPLIRLNRMAEGLPIFLFYFRWESPIVSQVGPVESGFASHAAGSKRGVCFQMNRLVHRCVHKFKLVHPDRTRSSPQIHRTVVSNSE